MATSCDIDLFNTTDMSYVVPSTTQHGDDILDMLMLEDITHYKFMHKCEYSSVMFQLKKYMNDVKHELDSDYSENNDEPKIHHEIDLLDYLKNYRHNIVLYRRQNGFDHGCATLN